MVEAVTSILLVPLWYVCGHLYVDLADLIEIVQTMFLSGYFTITLLF